MVARVRADRKKPVKAYNNLQTASRDSEGWYRLSDLGHSPSAFLKTDVGKRLLAIGRVELRFGALFGDEVVSAGFAVYRDPDNLQFIRIDRAAKPDTSTEAVNGDTDKMDEGDAYKQQSDKRSGDSVQKLRYLEDDII